MKIKTIKTIINAKFVNFFEAEYSDKKDNLKKWEFFSRKSNPFIRECDAVMIVPFIDDKIVFIKQYRVPANNYVYEFPAGLIDNNESIIDAVKRELKEETGLEITKYEEGIKSYNSVGISDETVKIVFVRVSGEPTNKYCEDSEDIQVLVKNRKEVKSLLENNLDCDFSSKCWLILKSFSDGHNWI